MTPPRIRSIAIINPLGDYGINAYCFELAEGLVSQGVHVDVYTSDASPLSELPSVRHHHCFPVLGSVLFKQPLTPWSPCASPATASCKQDREPEPGSLRNSKLWLEGRRLFLQLELARHLKRRGYDLVWTQWPDFYGHNFWRLCKVLGMTMAHTIHNVLPHEEEPRHIKVLRKIYAHLDLLFVHSEWSKNQLLQLFPEVHKRVLVAPHGMYTVYPRKPESRERVRRQLNIPDGHVAWLMCGGIRPYKNIDVVLAALKQESCANSVLIVAGQESGYADLSSEDRLARTRTIAQQLGVIDRVRLIPRFLRAAELAEVFEAADILVLPYLKHYGSGLLLLGMTFGKHIVATDTGGTNEYLVRYPRSTILNGGDTACVVEGVCRASRAVVDQGNADVPQIAEFLWPAIAHTILTTMNSIL